MKKEESRFTSSAPFEGMISVRSVIYATENGISDRRIKEVIYDGGREDKIKGEIGYLRAISEKYSFTVRKTDSEEFERVCVGTSHGGVAAYCTDRTPEKLDEIKSDGFYVYLDGIEDPYNFGYALRSIYAFGADGIILPQRNWLSASGVVCRASAGASEMMKMYDGADIGSICSEFKKKGYTIAAAEKEDSVSAFEANLKKPLLLAIGGEKRGNSRAILDVCDLRVKIEYGREFKNALSAASAASVLAYEVLRQNCINSPAEGK